MCFFIFIFVFIITFLDKKHRPKVSFSCFTIQKCFLRGLAKRIFRNSQYVFQAQGNIAEHLIKMVQYNTSVRRLLPNITILIYSFIYKRVKCENTEKNELFSRIMKMILIFLILYQN